jgi:hypothetical protein
MVWFIDLAQEERVERTVDSNDVVTTVRTLRGPNGVTVITETRDRNGNVSRSSQTSSGNNLNRIINVNGPNMGGSNLNNLFIGGRGLSR